MIDLATTRQQIVAVLAAGGIPAGDIADFAEFITVVLDITVEGIKPAVDKLKAERDEARAALVARSVDAHTAVGMRADLTKAEADAFMAGVEVDHLAEISDDPEDSDSDYGRGYHAGLAHGMVDPWPCPTIAALDSTDPPAERSEVGRG
jgi:hypothetical protein